MVSVRSALRPAHAQTPAKLAQYPQNTAAIKAKIDHFAFLQTNTRFLQMPFDAC